MIDKLKIHKFKILGGILGILFLAGAAFGAYKLGQEQIQPGPQPSLAENCVESATGQTMSFIKAKEIAFKSECAKEGTLKESHFCNDSSGTWWIDLDIQKEGCAPACVVDITSQQAEINWRCTGAKLVTPSESQKILCREPRPEVCTMECLQNPPYLCGSDGKAYCSGCQACAYREVDWYLLQNKPCEDIAPRKCLPYENPCDPKSCDYDPAKCKD